MILPVDCVCISITIHTLDVQFNLSINYILICQFQLDPCKLKDQSCQLPYEGSDLLWRCCETSVGNKMLYCHPKTHRCTEYKPKYVALL